MRKIAFFYKNLSSIEVELMEYFSLAGELARDPENAVYYIAPPDNAFRKRLADLNVHYFNCNTSDYSPFDRAIFITTLSSAVYLAEVAQQIPNARVIFLEWSGTDFVKLKREQELFGISMDSFFDLLEKKKSIAFSSSYRFLEMRNSVKNPFEPSFVPASFNAPNEFEYEVQQGIKEEETIHVGLLADYNNSNVWDIASLLKQLEDDRDFVIHICDNEVTRKKGYTMTESFSAYAPKIRFEFAGSLTPEDMIRYFRKNTDFVISKGTFAVMAAYAGVPVYIPIIRTPGDVDIDKFVPFHEMSGYSLRFSEKTASMDHLPIVSMETIIEQIMDFEAKEANARLDYEYAIKNHGWEHAKDCLFDVISSSSLNVSDMLECEAITQTFSVIESRKKKNPKIASYASLIRETYAERCAADPAVKKATRAKKHEERKKKLKEPLRKVKHSIVRRQKTKYYEKIYKGYSPKIEAIRKRFQEEKVLKVAFLTIFDAVFPGQPVFEEMLKHPAFDPYLIVMPDVDPARGLDYKYTTYRKSLAAFLERYGDEHVISGFDIDTETYLELHEDYPIVFFANPYANMAHEFHELNYFLDKNVLPLYICYGFAALKYVRNLYELDFYNLVWKVFIENEMNYQDYVRYAPMKGKNTFISGYIKMDELDEVELVTDRRKKIIIAPHHTVMGWDKLNLSNFTRYYEFFLNLAERFPEVDFVFRPHPLLFTNLINRKMWTKKRVKEYLERIEELPNMEYDNSGAYFDLFANSDGMIHDCGSFIGEYLFTEKPCAYMLKKPEDLENTFLPLGDACMDTYYKTYNEEDIISFVEDIVINGIDPLKKRREKFCKEQLKQYYPNCKNRVIDLLLDTLTK